MKKGFTLIELLAVIIILAIIALIAAISVESIISSSKSELSETQINRIEEIAKTYNIKEGMNKEVACVNVSELIEKGYVDRDLIKDPSTSEEMTGSVRIIKDSNKYLYTYQSTICPIPTCGDVDMNGYVELKDSVQLEKFVNNKITLKESQKVLADLNSDGTVDMDDATIFKQFLSGWDITLTCLFDPSTPTEPSTPVTSTICGDVDMNGYVELEDLVVLVKYLNNKRTLNETQKILSDVNSDSKVSSWDLTILQRFLSGWDVSLSCKST